MLLQPVEEIDNGIKVEVVSIPQAVGAVATPDASFEHYTDLKQVSIPQAVGAVATAGSRKPVFMRFKKLVLENLKP